MKIVYVVSKESAQRRKKPLRSFCARVKKMLLYMDVRESEMERIKTIFVRYCALLIV
jgi:hypothetical protein